MIIKSIEIENIRSYKKELIEFEKGINFLSGDIGSGKSSILQALEFGFLGFKRGDLEGIHLLRKGEKEASVKIILETNEGEIEIFRKIKKSKSGNISQENGFIKVGENLIELSPSELNSKIFEILNFPKEFISKDKNLIYRYTIYTPQEQLKEILFSDSEKRLEIIRKIFAIDKYKQLKDAISIYMSKIREDKSFFEGRVVGKDNLSEEILKFKEEVLLIQKNILEFENKKKNIDEELEKSKLSLNKRKDLLEKIQEKIILVEKNLSKIEIIENQNKVYEKEIIEKNIFFKNLNEKEFKDKILEQKDKIIKIENQLKLIEDKKIDLEKDEIKIKNLDDEILEISFNIKNIQRSLDEKKDEFKDVFHLKNCPTCKQEVSSKHKENLENKFEEFEKDKEKEILEFKKNQENLIKEKEKILKKILSTSCRQVVDNLKIIFEDLNKQEKNFSNQILDCKLEIEKEENNILKVQNYLEDIKLLNEKILQNKNIILKKEDLENKNFLLKEKEEIVKEGFKKAQKLIDEILEKEKIILNNLSINKTRFDLLNKSLTDKQIEFENLEKNKNNLLKLFETENFLSKKVVNIATLIETFVFTKYYSEFNEEFEGFFRDLIEDNEIDVRLNSEFTPIVEQNGYDIDISNLSGGEKSSLAISYRFGLKKIIESNLESAQKLSLLILDEPTDGFSMNQVDRLGEILKSLNVRQIILVSHDNRIDSISDKILNVEKINHISFVTN